MKSRKQNLTDMLAHKLLTKQTNLDIYKGCNEAPPPQHLPEEKYTFECMYCRDMIFMVIYISLLLYYSLGLYQ